MDAQQFAYWLQGFAELNEDGPTPEQWKAIKEHLSLVFKKVTPAYAPNRGERPETMPSTSPPPCQLPRSDQKPFLHKLMRSECSNNLGGKVIC